MKKATKQKVGRPANEIDESSFSGQIGALVRETRVKKKLTVEQCAAAAEVSVPAWYHYESGRHLGLEKLPRIAAALGVKTRAIIPES